MWLLFLEISMRTGPRERNMGCKCPRPSLDFIFICRHLTTSSEVEAASLERALATQKRTREFIAPKISKGNDWLSACQFVNKSGLGTP